MAKKQVIPIKFIEKDETLTTTEKLFHRKLITINK